MNQKNATHSLFFSRKNHLFFSVPKISELLKPNRIKEGVYWGGGDNGADQEENCMDLLKSKFL